MASVSLDDLDAGKTVHLDDLDKTPPKTGSNPITDFVHGLPQALNQGTRMAGQQLKKQSQAVAKTLKYGHEHPYESVLNVLGAPQRGLEAIESGQDLPHAIMTPSEQPRLEQLTNDKFGITALDKGPLRGNDLPHKLGRAVVHGAKDIVNDPVTWIPGLDVGKGLRIAAERTPVIRKVAGAVGKVLDSEAPLAGLTTEGKATFQTIIKRAEAAGDAMKHKQEALVKQNAAAIRGGTLPPSVQALFHDPANIPTITKGTRPQAILEALAQDRLPVIRDLQKKNLQLAGLIQNSGGPVVRNASRYFEDPTKVAEVQTQIAEHIRPNLEPNPASVQGALNAGSKVLQKATQLGNKAFLANPIPHTGNLTNLAYNKYGLPTTAKGLVNAVRVATNNTGGHLTQNIQELKNLGAHSQYHNIFDELGLTRVLGIPGTEGLAQAANKVIIPAERFSNAAQEKILNATETGLRSAALDAEKAGGTTGVEAARNIHRTFGTDAPNMITNFGSGVGAPFQKFHLETVPRSFWSTLGQHPGRITSALHAQQDYNQQVNPGSSPKYNPSTPTFSGARSAADFANYFSSIAGPLGQMKSPYSTLSQVQKGKLWDALFEIASRYTPGSEAAAAVTRALQNKKGRAGEDPAADVVTSIIGGYYAKAKP